MPADIHYLPGPKNSLSVQDRPNSIDCEQCYLGSVLVNNATLTRTSWLTAEDFYEPVHGRIYAALRVRFEAGEAADALSVKRLFDTDPALAELDGVRYLAQLAQVAGSIAEGVGWAKLIKRLARRRLLVEAGEALLEKARDPDDLQDPAEIVAELQRSLQAAAHDPTRIATQTVQSVIDAIVAELDNPPPLWSTRLRTLDAALGGGIPPGFVMGIEARPKQFKTGTLHTLWVAAARAGKRSHYFACEMGSARLVQRVLGHLGGFNSGMFKHRDSQLHQRVGAARMQMPRTSMTIDDCPGITLDRLKALASEYVLRHQVEVFFLDYWQLVRPPRAVRNRTEHLDEVAQWCADFAKEHQVSFFVASQENRDGLSRGSDGLIQACDFFATLHKHDRKQILEDGQEVETLWFDVKYSRDGPGEPIGGPEDAMFYIHRAGPHLAEL